MNSARAVDQVISRHMPELSKPGVLSVRPGYQAAGGWLTGKPAIVVTVDQKRDDIPPQDRLPETLEGIPVDVRQASPLHRLRATKPALYASVAAAVRPELERPTFPFERDLSGQDLSASAAAVAALRAPPKPQVKYAAPEGMPLDPVTATMTITCHASPDAGWTTLEPFLEQTTSKLTVGMYDFTSAHILESLQGALQAKQRKLNLVLDHPAPNPSRDQTDDQTYSDLEQSLGNRLSFAWALERNDPKAAQWIYPNAYHIKVAVQDSASFWLSSGNWNNSNQPDIDPVKDPTGSAAIARKSDRDWHVIVEQEKLAKLFEAYLLNDLSVASEYQAEGLAAAAAAQAALGELAQTELAVAARTPKQYFAPLSIPGESMKIQPLLTPDNYAQCILPLINGAKKSFYMQTQYIHPSDDPTLSSLIAAVAQKIQQGLDVRLIMSQWETLDYLEQLKDAGINLANVKIQNGVHNKGMIVDSEIAVVSSQNWSGDGVSRNRDAGLIIYNQKAALYWQKIFLHDWTNMAAQQAAD